MASSRFANIFSRVRPYAPDPWWLFTYATFIPTLVFIKTYVVEGAWVKGPSMYPYLNTDYDRSLQQDLCLNWKWESTEKLKRGMIVTFWSPNNPEVQAIKRIIALEGDQVYARAPYPYPIAQVPPGHVWVEGDGGRGRESLDSNTYGPISKNLITGRITHILLPWKSFGRVNWDQFKSKTRVIMGENHEKLQWN